MDGDCKDSMGIPEGDDDSSGKQKQLNGYCLRWCRLQKTVEIKEKSGGFSGSISSRSRKSFSTSLSESFRVGGSNSTKKDILSDISASALPGEVMALMGPSGSGKTSLLNVLSGRSSYDSGSISINGEVLTAQTMKRLMAKVAYVKQTDIFFDHLTVQDHLTYISFLRLPSTMSRSDKQDEVERIIRLLRLTKVQGSPIKLLSGGEKKRVNIGTELLTDPHVLLLDEPTSGLDSTSAVALIRLLQNFARKHGKTVVTSIHQPSSATFRSFDKLLLLSEGCVVYFGTPVDSLDYLRSLDLACPDGYNAADHWMDLLVIDSSIEEEQEADSSSPAVADETGTMNSRREQFGAVHKDRKSPRAILQNAWDNDAAAEETEKADSMAADETTSVATDNIEEIQKYNTSWLVQYLVLTHRSLKNSRAAIFTPLNLVKSFCIGVVAGLVWLNMDYTERTVFDRGSYFFFTMAFWVFDSMFQALMAFPAERMVILKERASGSYHLSAYFMAKTTSDAPVRIALPLLYMIPSYWMAGIDNRFSMFLASTGCTLLSVLAGEAIGLCIGAGIPDMEKAMTCMTVGALALMLVGGFFVQNIPSFLTWAKFLSPFKYSFDASRQLVFTRDVPCDGSGVLEELCGGSDTGSVKASDVLDFFYTQGSIGFNVGMLVVICLFPRYLAYLFLKRQKAGERS